jgi:hypothetical protein
MLVGREDDVVRGAFALRRRAPHRLDCGYVLAHRWWRSNRLLGANLAFADGRNVCVTQLTYNSYQSPV